MKLTMQLNDFEAFDRILFNENEVKLPEDERWKKFYHADEGAIYIPLPEEPKTEVEFQFCHYIYWMTIGACQLVKKPIIYFKFADKSFVYHPYLSCFACEYKLQVKEGGRPCDCPIKRFFCASDDKSCIGDPVSPYQMWIQQPFNSEKHAYELAQLRWREDFC